MNKTIGGLYSLYSLKNKINRRLNKFKISIKL